DLAVADAPRTVRGRVVARDRSPVLDARVELCGERGSIEARTDADGAFAFAGVYARGRLTLTAKVAGHVEAEKEVATADEAGEHVLVLDPGQRVTLRVVDEQGHAVETDARAEQ